MSNRLARVQDVIENYRSSVYEKDVEKYISAYASDVRLFDCWDAWEVVGISAWTEIVKEWFGGLQEEGVMLKTEFDDVIIEENANLAFVRCFITFAAYNESDEKLRQITNRFTFGLRKENDSWIIVHQHSSNPIHGETGKGIFKRN